MTTMQPQPPLDEILAQLTRVQSRRRRVRLMEALTATGVITLAALLAMALGGGYWPDQPPALLRWGLLLGGLAGVGWAMVGWVLRAAMWRQNPAQTARFIEQSIPQVRNDLINSVLLAGDKTQASPELVARAIAEAAGRSRQVDLAASISRRPLQRWLTALAIAVVTFAAVAIFQGGPMKRGLLAVLAPQSFVAPLNDLDLLALEPGDASMFAGESLAIVARIRNDQAHKLAGQLLLEGRANQPMLASEGYSRFTATLKADETFRYAVQIGQSRWPTDRPWYTVTVRRQIQVKGLDLTIEPPPYTGQAPKTQTNADGPIEAPAGAVATVTVRLSEAVPSAAMEFLGGQALPMRRDSRSEGFLAQFPIDANGGYRVVLRDSAGQIIQQLPDLGDGSAAPNDRVAAEGYYPIRAVPDKPPVVEFAAPKGDVSIPPGGKLSIRIKASDDYGLTALTLSGTIETPSREVLNQAFPVAGRRDHQADYEFTVPADLKDDGSVVIVYQASATDNRLLRDAGSQTTHSAKLKIVVQNAEKLAAERAKRYEELRKRLLAMLAAQEKLRVDTGIARTLPPDPARLRPAGEALGKGQWALRGDLLDLAEKFPFEQEMISVQQACALLANNEAQTAVEQARVLAAAADLPARDKACDALATTQDAILDALRTLLAIVPSLAGKAPGETPESAGADLPPEAREKLQDLKKDLEKYIDNQKKLIAASERLAKKPVDSFTGEDEKLLHELTASQENWEKFINEAFTDFSKLAQQDFSNPMMLKELISVKSDITMAKDALSKKAVEIATAMEDNGVENAESLTANIEKWLPDKPDREKWDMEDPVGGQQNTEQPNLPTELEDLVGDLLEEEEDLFEEMDDLTSKAMMSGDKGIGWDALDGPISNMNAQGVTGNQLPNTNELSGRSGEGRTGKSSGEFVEDKAVGKGGRRTPTRLTPEPFQKGQINDVSKDEPGGATGGGKISGSGEEGLEGPVPPDFQRDMKRLAGKQAVLVNRAERLRAQFKPEDYSNFKFLQAITAMKRVQHDLANYRYQNVLRAREETVATLRQSHLLLGGKIDVAKDSSSAMPKYVRDDIADAMKGKLPDAYRDVLQQYYKRLGEQGK